MLWLKIPLRHCPPEKVEAAIEDTRKAILTSATLPGWAIADFDADKVVVVAEPEEDT